MKNWLIRKENKKVILIRYKDYSLIKSCNQKIIITSRGDCDKYFSVNKFVNQCVNLFKLCFLGLQ